MEFLIRVSSKTQLWLLRHSNFLSRAALSVFYGVEVLIYSFGGAKTFLTTRQTLMRSNYAALGKLIGEYEAAAAIIKNP